MFRAAVLALALAGSGACKKQEKRAPAPEPAPPMPANEIQRSQESCKAYVDKVCGCSETMPALVEQCSLAKSLPEALRISLEVAASPDSKPDIVLQAQASVRKTMASCIEKMAKLPASGCP